MTLSHLHIRSNYFIMEWSNTTQWECIYASGRISSLKKVLNIIVQDCFLNPNCKSHIFILSVCIDCLTNILQKYFVLSLYIDLLSLLYLLLSQFTFEPMFSLSRAPLNTHVHGITKQFTLPH